MTHKIYTHGDISLADLKLDVKNPRFAELYNWSNNEEDLINYLLENESGKEIAENISERQEFYEDRPLWVIKEDNKYLVKDGNRRCAAVKALQDPEKYGLTKLKNFKIDKLPVFIYSDVGALESRIREEHTASLFRDWGRIAKAIEAYRLKTDWRDDELPHLDSQPRDLIKLASFYYEAVKIRWEDLKKLLRSGKGKNWGKAIIFERLFSLCENCGYRFEKWPSYEIEVFDSWAFKNYINTVVDYLEDNPETTHKSVDKRAEAESFLREIAPDGFFTAPTPAPQPTAPWATSPTGKNNTPSASPDTQPWKGHSAGPFKPTATTPGKKTAKPQTHPRYTRAIPKTLKDLIDECFDLPTESYPNAKMAITRMTFECILKYVCEETDYKSKKISTYSHFHDVYYDKKGNKRPFTNFENMKTDFANLIVKKWDQSAFNSFKLEPLQQVMHNPKVTALIKDADSNCNMLMHLIEFLLKDEASLLTSLNLSKLT